MAFLPGVDNKDINSRKINLGIYSGYLVSVLTNIPLHVD